MKRYMRKHAEERQLGTDSCVDRWDWVLAETRVEAGQGAGGDTQKHGHG